MHHPPYPPIIIVFKHRKPRLDDKSSILDDNVIRASRVAVTMPNIHGGVNEATASHFIAGMLDITHMCVTRENKTFTILSLLSAHSNRWKPKEPNEMMNFSTNYYSAVIL